MAEWDPTGPISLNVGDILHPSLFVTDYKKGDIIPLLDIAKKRDYGIQIARERTLFVLLRHSN